MLAEKKVILMTRMAMFKKREGQKDDAAGRYFPIDYITHHIIGSIVCATVVFAVVCALYILSHFDLLMQDIYSTDIMGLIRDAVKYYVIGTVVYCVFSATIYAVRYHNMQRRVRKYAQGLRRLQEMNARAAGPEGN